MRPPRSAFSAIEGLVAISLIVLALTALLPALRMLRDTARLTHGQDNLAHIGLAVLAYHDHFKSLPHNGSGALAPDPDSSGFEQPGPWTWQLLPFIGHEQIVSQRDFSARVDRFLCPGRARSPVVQSESPLVRLSADPEQHNGWWPTDYAINLAAFPEVYPEDEISRLPAVLARLHPQEGSSGLSNTIWGGERSLSIRRYACSDANLDEAAFFGGFGGTGRSGVQVISDSQTSPAGQNSWGSPFRGGAPFVYYDGHVGVIRFGADLTRMLSARTEIVAGSNGP